MGTETRKNPTSHKVDFISEASKTCSLQISTHTHKTHTILFLTETHSEALRHHQQPWSAPVCHSGVAMLPKCDVFRVVFLSPQLPHDCFSLSSLELGIFMRQNQRWFQWGALGPVVFEIAKNLLCRGTGGQVCRKFLKISCGVIGTGAGGVTQMDRAQRDMPCGRAAPGSAAVEGAVMGGSAPSGPTGCPGRTCGPGELTAWPEAPGQPPDRQGPQLLGWMQCGGAWSPPRGTALRRRKGGRSRHIPETPEGKKWGGWECYSLPEGPSETRGAQEKGRPRPLHN